MLKITTINERETRAIGVALGQQCRGGEIFAISGALGAGKTKLVQGLAAGLDFKSRVNSPTFNILKVYKLKSSQSKKGIKIERFFHIDAYRLRSAADLEALGAAEIFNDRRAVVAIEWAERVKKILPPGTVAIRILSSGGGRRTISLK